MALVAAGAFELEAGGGHTDFEGPAKIVIRPERVELEPHGSPSGPNRVPGMVERRIYVGSAEHVIVRAATGETLQALVQNTGKSVQYEQGTPLQAPSTRRRAPYPSERGRRSVTRNQETAA